MADLGAAPIIVLFDNGALSYMFFANKVGHCISLFFKIVISNFVEKKKRFRQ